MMFYNKEIYMEGISRTIIALITYYDDLIFTYCGPNDKGKYSGWIFFSWGAPLYNTTSEFDTGDAAEQHVRNISYELKQLKKERENYPWITSKRF